MSTPLPDDGQAKTLQPPKAWYMSRTILGALIGPIVLLLAVVAHVDLRGQEDNIITAIQAAGVLIGTIMVIVGRLKASAPINGTDHAAETVEIRKAIAVDSDLQAKIEGARKAANPKA